MLMKNCIIKKIANIFLAITILITSLMINVSPVKASENYVNILHKISTATANSPINYNFSLSRNSDIYFIVRTNERTGVTISVKEPDHDVPSATITLAETNPNWKYDKSSGIYQNTSKIKLDSGNYILELRFDIDVNYDLTMNQLSPVATLNKTKVTITNGFSNVLKVNGGKIKSCSSSNNKIATVNSKGKITAKNNGVATIRVKLTNGKTLSCKVNVVSNQYNSKKITVNSTVFNTYDMKAYNAKFDSKGNLVVKFMVVNDSYGKINSIPKFKITVKNAKKKTVISYAKASYKVIVPSYKGKACTVTIPKSCFKVEKNKIDIRTSTIKISGQMANASL